jgi:hypothetical protein
VGDFLEDVFVRSPGGLGHVKTVIGGFQPVHRPIIETANRRLHQVPTAEAIACAVEAQDRNTDIGKMSRSKSVRLAGRVKRVGQEQETVAPVAVGRKKGGGSSAHGPTAEDGPAWPKLFDAGGGNRGHAFLKEGHRIRSPAAVFLVEEVEPQNVEPHGGQGMRDGQHPPIGLVPARSVGAHKQS